MNFNELVAVMISWVLGALIAIPLIARLGLGRDVSVVLGLVVGLLLGLVTLWAVMLFLAWLVGLLGDPPKRKKG